MLRRYLNAEELLVSAPTDDLAFEILMQLKTSGRTATQLAEKLPGGPTRKAVCACLDRMHIAGLLFQLRSDNSFEWWANRKGIADAAARLTEIAAMLPERSLEMISEESRQNAYVSRLTKFFAMSYRRDILQTLQKHPATPGEIFRRISPRVGPHAIHESLRILLELGLVAAKVMLITRQAGGFQVKQYSLTPKGIATFHMFSSENPVVEAAGLAKPC
jgi:E3 ubiquitin-protein ligase DOA10